MRTSGKASGAEGLSGKLWPAHVKPLEDELLSSWLVRLARAHGLRLHTFCDLAWRRKAIWNRDIDKSADDEILQVLSEKTATPIERVRQTTLAAYEGWLYEKHNPYGNTKWIMPVGVYHRTRKRPGLQYCPTCLREDEDPYFRRRWRLAFVTLCERHERLLLDRCPQCKTPVNFHRISSGKSSITLCYGCGHDFRRSRGSRSVWWGDLADHQTELVRVLERGWVEIPQYGPVFSHLYFDVLHQAVKTLVTGEHSAQLRRSCCGQIKMYMCRARLPAGSREFEKLGVEDRTHLVAFACWLLRDWPTRFITVYREHNALSSVLLKDMMAPPYWYWNVVREHLYDPDRIVSDDEIRSAMDYLWAMGVSPRERRISRLLGVNQVFRRRGGKDRYRTQGR